MRRPPKVVWTIDEALDAARKIYTLRAQARPTPDPDLDYYPRDPVDDDDIDAAIRYLHRHTRVDLDVRRAEVYYRAVLVEYRRQRDEQENDTNLRDLLNTAHLLHARPKHFGPALNLPTRQHVWNRRHDLNQQHHRHNDTALEQSGLQNDAELHQWLQKRRHQLAELAAALVDDREYLLQLVQREPYHSHLISTIDSLGGELRSHPTPSVAAGIAHIAWLIHQTIDSVPDPVVRDHVAQATRLRSEFNDIV